MARIKYEITEQMPCYMPVELFSIDSDPRKRAFDFVAESPLKKGWARAKARQFLLGFAFLISLSTGAAAQIVEDVQESQAELLKKSADEQAVILSDIVRKSKGPGSRAFSDKV